jgi:hypothetical protein
VSAEILKPNSLFDDSSFSDFSQDAYQDQNQGQFQSDISMNLNSGHTAQDLVQERSGSNLNSSSSSSKKVKSSLVFFEVINRARRMGNCTRCLGINHRWLDC